MIDKDVFRRLVLEALALILRYLIALEVGAGKGMQKSRRDMEEHAQKIDRATGNVEWERDF